jgi:hypothetical protein
VITQYLCQEYPPRDHVDDEPYASDYQSGGWVRRLAMGSLWIMGTTRSPRGSPGALHIGCKNRAVHFHYHGWRSDGRGAEPRNIMVEGTAALLRPQPRGAVSADDFRSGTCSFPFDGSAATTQECRSRRVAYLGRLSTPKSVPGELGQVRGEGA